MYRLEIRWGNEWITLPGLHLSREGAHWAASEWRARWGRPTEEGDPFRCVPVPQEQPNDVAVRF